MKKIIPVFLIVALLAGCSGNFQLPDFNALLTTPTPVPVDTATPQPTVTKIPTKNLFALSSATPVTFTPTEAPLLPNAPATAIPIETLIPLPTFSEEFINDQSRVTFFNENVGFKGVLYSAGTLYWGEGACVTRSIKFTVFVEDPERTDRVFLFMRLRDKQNTLNVGEWNAGSEMIKVEDGSFNYNIETYHLRRYSGYKNAWIEYEFVSVNENNEILGRTQLYDRNLSLAKCGL
jgi:hypothetical protein